MPRKKKLTPQIRVTLEPLSKLRRAPRNPKQHALADLDQSFSRFGFVAPVILNEKTGTLVVGHGRLDALIKRWESGETPPERIESRDGEWFVPVIRGVSFESDAEAEAYLLADNRLTELGGWDSKELAEMLEGQVEQTLENLNGLGWDTSALLPLLEKYRPDSPVIARIGEAGNAGLTDPDAVPEPPKKPVSRTGDLWLLGEKGHRVLCGDSTKAADVERLMGGDRADMVFTDPPYGMNLDTDYSKLKGTKKARMPWATSTTR